ncbi:MAG: hypothetical protein GKR89_12020 [Candidatus Latescibacteria bacterium]|nr:hypothetical protein [Candidatus Latescibacterota bacterium]
MQALLLSGPNHGFDTCVPHIAEGLNGLEDCALTISSDKEILASNELAQFDTCIFGTGFTTSAKGARKPDLTTAQEDGLFNFVSGGKGLVGIHGTAWWIGGRAVDLIGGHANWHPPGLQFTVEIGPSQHPAIAGLSDFDVEDEIYISAHEPQLEILATATWHGKAHPLVWVKPFGKGRVFYTALGHGPGTYKQPGMQALLAQGLLWASKSI